MVSRRLSDRGARQSAGHLSGRGTQGRCGSSRLVDGDARSYQASVVVLAAWSAQNPRLLLNSATDKHPKGLGNASGLVGHFMMSHHVANTWAMFDEDVQNHKGTVAVQYMSYERYPKKSHDGV